MPSRTAEGTLTLSATVSTAASTAAVAEEAAAAALFEPVVELDPAAAPVEAADVPSLDSIVEDEAAVVEFADAVFEF